MNPQQQRRALIASSVVKLYHSYCSSSENASAIDDSGELASELLEDCRAIAAVLASAKSRACELSIGATAADQLMDKAQMS